MNATDSTQADIKTVVIVELSVWAVFTLLTFLMLLRLLFVLRGSTCRQQLEPNFKRILINIVVVQAIASSAQLFYAIPLYFVYDQRSLIRTIFNIRTRIVVLAFTFKCYLNLVLACNRYTAMAFPIMQKTIWTSSRLNKLLLAMWLCFVTSVTGFSIATCFLNDKIYIKVVFFTCPILSIIPTIVIYCRIVCILCKMKSRHSKNMIPTIAATVTTTMGKCEFYSVQIHVEKYLNTFIFACKF
ncbi:hypothetical protein PFISCL1PPCAC_4845 [Pristionchus fissidentatus]|uniref:G protein-coupled receptor n=1 Tax=Pristionchus fissidentatus TaxID=1538716 RepID=A0AAV5V393_9BILA|nr:hypothetical protein PFISCL1PPCAC_4845 [Pristionchus fissidentatus]